MTRQGLGTREEGLLRQVVNGESAIFDERETVMRRDAAALRRARPLALHDLPLECATPNCSRVRWPGSRYCEKCATENAALDVWAATKRNRRDAGYGSRARVYAERLKTFALLALFAAMLSALAYYLFPFFYATWKLWSTQFGGQ